MTVKVRFAPSPTGHLHLGGVRTALFNWLFARKNDGQFILRIEDTDLERSDKKYEEDIIDSLMWLGLTWDNAKVWRQSEHLDVYERYLKELLGSGKAFWCHHTKEELEAEQGAQMKAKEPPRHVCGNKGTERGGRKGELIRLAVDSGSSRDVVFDDLVRGPIQTSQRLLGDVSLAKDLRKPLYNFAVVVDDLELGITHVLRAEEHISNTPKQILIYEALGKPFPLFGHVPLILNPDRTKLSKRVGSTSVSDYRKDYLPEALVNFLGFLGFTYSKEIISKEEMAQEFDLAKVHKSGAVFNLEKLNWFNAQYVKRLDASALRELSGIKDIPEAAVPLMTERLEKLSDAHHFSYFWKQPEYEAALLSWKGATDEQTRGALEAVQGHLRNFTEDKEELRRNLEELAVRIGNKGLVFWSLRVALTGKEASPDPVDIAFVLGRDEALKRVDRALALL